MMRHWGKTPHLLVMLSGLCFSVAHADDAAKAATPAASAAGATSASSSAAGGGSVDAAREALKQKSDDATSEKNLEQVFKASEKTYSLLKRGDFAMNYGFDYSFYRDTRIDIAMDNSSSAITRFRIEEDSQNTFTNSMEFSYGFRDNLTLTSSLPLVYKIDSQNNRTVLGLGDVSFGLRWQPVPLKRGLPSTTIFGSFSTATGDSPYEINSVRDLSTGKGYYSMSGGLSMSKVLDPLVIYGSASMSVGNKIGKLNQARGGRILEGVDPGSTIGFSMGFAYSLNYDVSMSASYQQSINMNTRFKFSNGNIIESPVSVSSLVNFTLSLRTNPKRIVNLSLGYGLTEDTPDVTLGISMPVEFLGLGTGK